LPDIIGQNGLLLPKSSPATFGRRGIRLLQRLPKAAILPWPPSGPPHYASVPKRCTITKQQAKPAREAALLRCATDPPVSRNKAEAKPHHKAATGTIATPQCNKPIN